MMFTAQQISDLLNGKIEGNPDTQVSGFARIEEGKPGDICFLANPKYIEFAYTTQASVLLVGLDFVPRTPIAATLIRVADVYSSISVLMEQYAAIQAKNAPKGNVDSLAFIAPDATIGEGSSAGPFVYIGKGASIGNNCTIYPHVFIDEGVTIGDDTVLYSGVRIYRQCQIGNKCIIHANAVIGSDGFGYAPQPDGSWKKIPQLGNVVVGNDVEIGANTCIDRAVMGSTVIEDGVKLDNLIQIAHNVAIGENTAIAAQAGIAGSTRLGKGCMIGGQAGFVGHINIADKVKVQAQSGVNREIETPGSAWYGSPAIPYNDYLRAYSLFRKLPDLEKRIALLEKENKAFKAD